CPEKGVMRRVLLRWDVKGGNVRSVMCLEIFGFNQGRGRSARTVPMAQVKPSFGERVPVVGHRARQQPQLGRGVCFYLADVLGVEILTPSLHFANQGGLVGGCPTALDHTVDDRAERRTEETENVVNPDVRGMI